MKGKEIKGKKESETKRMREIKRKAKKDMDTAGSA